MIASVAAGVLDLGFAVFHLMFWSLFSWPERLGASGKVNSAITQTLNWMLIYVFTVYGTLLIWLAPSELAGSSLLAGAGAGFWVLRFVLQPCLFPMRNWQSITITTVFAVNAILHAAAAVSASL